MARFQVREGEHPGDASPQYAVVDTANDDLPVARFASRDDARAHAQKLEQGPLDWDEQDAWKDDWKDDWDDDEPDGART